MDFLLTPVSMKHVLLCLFLFIGFHSPKSHGRSFYEVLESGSASEEDDCVSDQWEDCLGDPDEENKGIKNIGHRVGAGKGEYHSNLPENSLVALHELLQGKTYNGGPAQFHPKMDYLEFDIQETADGKLVLFHDKTLARMLPMDGKNSAAYDHIMQKLKERHMAPKSASDLEVRHLTLEQLKTLVLAQSDHETVPTLEEFFDKCIEWKIKRPVAVEIKRLQSDSAREYLIYLVALFRERLQNSTNIQFSKRYDLDPSGVGFISFGKSFKRSYYLGNQQKKSFWCDRFQEAGFKKVYMAMFHWLNLCR